MQSRSRISWGQNCGQRTDSVGHIRLQLNYTPPSWKKERITCRQERYGKLFSVNVAGHLTSDDMFLLGEKTWREKEKKWLTTKKNKRARLMNIETKEKKVLEKKGHDKKCFLGSDCHRP